MKSNQWWKVAYVKAKFVHHVKDLEIYLLARDEKDLKASTSGFELGGAHNFFTEIQSYAAHRDTPNKGIHIIQSFHEKETAKLSIEFLHQMGREFIEKAYPGFDYMVVSHWDTEHKHNHILLNNYSLENDKLIRNKYSVRDHLRDVSDDIISRYGFEIIHEKPKGQVHGFFNKVTPTEDEESKPSLKEKQFMYRVETGFALSNNLKEFERVLEIFSVEVSYTKNGVIFDSGKGIKNLNGGNYSAHLESKSSLKQFFKERALETTVPTLSVTEVKKVKSITMYSLRQHYPDIFKEKDGDTYYKHNRSVRVDFEKNRYVMEFKPKVTEENPEPRKVDGLKGSPIEFLMAHNRLEAPKVLAKIVENKDALNKIKIQTQHTPFKRYSPGKKYKTKIENFLTFLNGSGLNKDQYKLFKTHASSTLGKNRIIKYKNPLNKIKNSMYFYFSQNKNEWRPYRYLDYEDINLKSNPSAELIAYDNPLKYFKDNGKEELKGKNTLVISENSLQLLTDPVLDILNTSSKITIKSDKPEIFSYLKNYSNLKDKLHFEHPSKNDVLRQKLLLKTKKINEQEIKL